VRPKTLLFRSIGGTAERWIAQELADSVWNSGIQRLQELTGRDIAVRRVARRYARVMLECEAWLGRLDFEQELMGAFFGSSTKRSSASVTQSGEAGLCLVRRVGRPFVGGELRAGSGRAGWAGDSE